MSTTTSTNPSTEGKAPVKTATTGTSATKATAATDTTKATATAQITSGTTMEATPPAQNAAATLPDNYLTGGYFRGEGKGRYTDPALIEQAEAIAKALAESGTPASAVKKMARTLKKAAGPRFPFPAKQAALKALTPQVLDLEHKKKAPPMLREIVIRNTAAVQDKADFAVCVEHFQHIAIYLADAQG